MNKKVVFVIGIICGMIISVFVCLLQKEHHQDMDKQKSIKTYRFIGSFYDNQSINIDSIYSNDFLPLDVIPDVETAVKVCEPILISAYGEDIMEERPYMVKLCNNNFWRISGSLPSQAKQGGTFSIIIQKSDGKVIKMYHTK